jgi:tripartite-type tricarboxylate transporter receptor subunit TctC
MLLNPVEVLPHVNAGKLRALAVASSARIPMLPDVPTMAEAGVPGFEASVWWGFVAPAKVSPDVVTKLNAEVVKAIADPSVKTKLTELGVIFALGTPEQFGTFLASEVDKWGKVIKSAKITAD